jgi:hypothetical protein
VIKNKKKILDEVKSATQWTLLWLEKRIA